MKLPIYLPNRTLKQGHYQTNRMFMNTQGHFEKKPRGIMIKIGPL